ncbi:MAG: phage holin family protein [Burkholderiaceae bacterium]
MPPKLIPSLRQLISTAAGLAHTRLALAGVELEEEIQRLLGAALLGLVALVLVLLALIVGTFTIVAAVPPEYRVVTMIVITLVYLVIAAVLAMRLRSIFQLRPPIFGATLAELEKDKETWSHMARAHQAADDAADHHAHFQEDAFAHVEPADVVPSAESSMGSRTAPRSQGVR